MRNLLYVLAFIFLFGCSLAVTKQKETSIQSESKFKKLLSTYTEISFDTLKVYADVDLESSTYRYRGTQLDSADVALFPKVLSEQYANDNGYFACYKFSIDSSRIGLITRTPSVYEPSSIKLLFFDKEQDAFTDFIELAEAFGDAGDITVKTSWLYKDERRKYNSFIWMEESHDNSGEIEKDTTIERWNNYSLVDISKSKADTISTDQKSLATKFVKLLQGQASL